MAEVLSQGAYFGETGSAFDPRLESAVEALLAKRGSDGRWVSRIDWPGQTYLEVDAPEGEPSRWNTLRALRVLRWARAGSDD